jgi:hypothetical protein
MMPAYRNLLTAAMMATTLAAAPLALAKDEPQPAATMVTVYISGHGGSTIAKSLNESHANMEKNGWRFANLEVHTENGDTKGAWVTYTK